MRTGSEEAHPRSRGENLAGVIGDAGGEGSSPLTRGKLILEHIRHAPPGLIPAHAGKTGGNIHHSIHTPAHPRSRGENLSVAYGGRYQGGSSPLTRGKPEVKGSASEGRRLIPAHAGKTSARLERPAADAAHPRSRGENLCFLVLEISAVGSSPLTRGKLRRTTSRQTSPRLIPAHAGKTLLESDLGELVEAHPRSRGENGSGVSSSWRVTWLIPAHAGKT